MPSKRFTEDQPPRGARAPRLRSSIRSAVAIACLAAAAWARAEPGPASEQPETPAAELETAADPATAPPEATAEPPMARAEGSGDTATGRPEAGEEITVTGTREARRLRETPLSIGVVGTSSLHIARPTHPQQVLSQVPGAAVAITNGEGHTTAIRQPFTTSPVYLFLEDGIPVRATGFFNHNALYELNVAGAGRMEVVRGPGTALYGSDAVAGVVNVVTAPSAPERQFSISTEGGSSAWLRLLASGSTGQTAWGGARADLNFSHSDGWRERTGYDRQSGTARWDLALSDTLSVKTILSAARVDQETGANAALPRELYERAPRTNLHGIAFRDVEALRLSVEVERQGEADLVAVTPYFRRNRMVLNGSFNLSFDPRIETSENLSLGVLARWRHDFSAWRSRLVAGLDLDYSPGSRSEDNLLVTRVDSGASTRYTDYTIGTRIYDYGVAFHSVSPYLHAETSPLERVRLTAGLRFDALGYRMSNHLPQGAVSATVNLREGTPNPSVPNRYYGQLGSQAVDYTHLSPKLGVTWSVLDGLSLHASYAHGFRVPSEGQLFRAGNATSAEEAQTRARLALELDPIRADQLEVGARFARRGYTAEVVVYDLVKRDDLVSQRDTDTNVTTNVNAGRTDHRGIEVGAGAPLPGRLRLDAAFSYARHEYADWVAANDTYSGKEMETAPRTLGSARLTWTPLRSTMGQLEWVHMGSYWLEASNSPARGKYGGHDLLNLRASYAPVARVELFARVTNLLDSRFAESASVSSNEAVYSPGLPRAIFAGVEGKL